MKGYPFSIPPELEGQVPPHLYGGLKDYFEERQRPGGFLVAVLKNDLMGATKRADFLCKTALPGIIDVLLAEAPACAWGSEEKVEKWLSSNDDKPADHKFEDWDETQRAELGRLVLVVFIRQALIQYETDEAAIEKLLVCLRHLALYRGLDWDKMDEASRVSFADKATWSAGAAWADLKSQQT